MEGTAVDALELRKAAAEVMGLPVSEVVEVLESPAGPVVTTKDGVSYVLDRSDKSRGDDGTWKYLAKPSEKYNDTLAVFENVGADFTLEATDDTPRRARRNRGRGAAVTEPLAAAPDPSSDEAIDAQAAASLRTGPTVDEDEDLDGGDTLEDEVLDREGDLDDDKSLEELVADREEDLDAGASLEQLVAEREGTERDGGTVDFTQLDKGALINYARDHGIDVKANWSHARILEAITDATRS